MSFTLNSKIHELLDQATRDGGLVFYELPAHLILNSPPVGIIIAVGENNVKALKEHAVSALDAQAKINRANSRGIIKP